MSLWELEAVSNSLYPQSIPLMPKQAQSIHDSRPRFPQHGLWTMTAIINRRQELVTKIVPGPIPTLLCQNSHFPKHCQATTICKAPIGTHCVPRASLELGLAIMPPMAVTKALKHAYRLTIFTSLCCDAVRNRYSAELNSTRLFLQNWLYSFL